MSRNKKYTEETTDNDQKTSERLYQKNKARRKDAIRKEQRKRKNRYKNDDGHEK